jgi:N-succinyldiaminopimelate aminotransferase
MTDEVYEHLVYSDPTRAVEHVPMASIPGMRERTITISSAGKTFSFTGWKVGWLCASPDLVAAVRTVKQFLTYVNAAPFQHAVATALDLGDDFYDGFAADMRAKRDLLVGGLRAAGFGVHVPDGTYFVTTDIRPLGEHDGMAFCRALPERAGVVAIPAVVLYDDVEEGSPLVRFAFCKRTDVLEDAVERLSKLAAP